MNESDYLFDQEEESIEQHGYPENPDTMKIHADTDVNGVTYKGNTDIIWYSPERKQVFKGILARPQWIDHYHVKKYIYYYKGGNIRQSEHAVDTTIQVGLIKIPIKGGSKMRVYPNGIPLHASIRHNIRWKDIYLDIEIAATPDKSSSIGMAPNGTLMSARLSKAFYFFYKGKQYGVDLRISWYFYNYPPPRDEDKYKEEIMYGAAFENPNQYSIRSIGFKKQTRFDIFTIAPNTSVFFHQSTGGYGECGHIRTVVNAVDIIIDGHLFKKGKAIHFNEDGTLDLPETTN